MGEESDDDSSNLSQNEALTMLLGGLAVGDLSMAAWDNESDQEQDIVDTRSRSPASKNTVTNHSEKRLASRKALSYQPVANVGSDQIFARAYTCLGYCTRDGRMERPPLKVVNAGESLGNIAIATRFIRKGETIFTERAAVAAQLYEKQRVRACQHCFRSLEPAASCSLSPDHPTIPMSHLWPVMDIHLENMTQVTDYHGSCCVLLQDDQRRVFCPTCQTWFCNRQCLDAHEQEMGLSHCIVASIWKELPTIDSNVQSAVILATRVFCIIVQQYRSTGQVYGTFLDGLCGSSADTVPLELGIEVDVVDGGTKSRSTTYSLAAFYELLAEKIPIAPAEQDQLSLLLFRRLAAIAARNSVGLRTQSPFKSYYGALLRHAGGWGSEKHSRLISELALALGSEKLDRSMDFQVEDRVAPAIAALFTLTARLNHSCSPNAEIQAQVFMDSHIDVVAIEDIQRDEEITISYLGPVRQSSTVARRRRELRAKYLFECCCSLCSNATFSPSTGLVVGENE